MVQPAGRPIEWIYFSSASEGTYSNSLSYANYGTAINATVYVKIVTNAEGNFFWLYPCHGGGGVATANVHIVGMVLNTSPVLNANVTTISCYNKKGWRYRSANRQEGWGHLHSHGVMTFSSFEFIF